MKNTYIHPETIKEVKEKTDIYDIVSERVTLRKRGKNYVGLCPFHEEKTPSFTVNTDKQFYHCFGCGASGDSIKFLQEIDSSSFTETIFNLADRYQVPIKAESPKQQQEILQQRKQRQQLYEILALANSYYQHALGQPQGQKALGHLKMRQIQPATIKQFQLGYAPNAWGTLYDYLVNQKGFSVALVEKAGLIVPRKSNDGYYDRFRDRLMIPILDIQGRVVGFGARTLNNENPKYINSPQTELFEKGRTLFALDKAKAAISKEGKAIVVEGYFDAISLHQAGVNNVVASLGTALSRYQINQLSRHTSSHRPEIILSFDSDDAGIKATNRAVSEIEGLAYSGLVNLRVLEVLDGAYSRFKDAEEFIREHSVDQYRLSIERSPLWLDWQINQLLHDKELQQANDFAQVGRELVELLSKIVDDNQLTFYLQRCAEILAQGDRPRVSLLTNNLLAQVVSNWQQVDNSAAPLLVKARIEGFLSTQAKEKKEGKKEKGDRTSLLDSDAITEAIDEIIGSHLSQDKLYLRLLEVQRKHSISESQVNKFYELRANALEKEDNLAEFKKELDTIIKARDSSIDLRDILPISLASKIFRFSQGFDLKPECALTAMLTTVSSLHTIGTEVVALQEKDYAVSPNLFGTMVAESGEGKSPVVKLFIKKPLRRIRDKHRQEFKDALIHFENELSRFKSIKDQEERKAAFPEGMPKRPKQKQCLITKTTGEAIYTSFAAFPERGILLCVDELASFFNSMNQYRGGRGSDEQDLLSLHDGDGGTVNRVEGAEIDIDRTLLSIFGGIQPKILKDLKKDEDDANGKWARFLYVHQPIVAPQVEENIQEQRPSILGETLDDLYEAIDELPKIRYRFSLDAERLFRKYHNQLKLRRKQAHSPAIRNIIGKSITRIAKLAVNLHCINHVMNERTPPCLIDIKTVKDAGKLALWYAQQAIYTINLLEPSEMDIPQHFLKIIDLSQQRQDYVTARDVYTTVYSSKSSKQRPKADLIREWFRDLEKMGYGKTRGEKTKFSFLAFKSSPDGDGDGGGTDGKPKEPPHPPHPPHPPENSYDPSVTADSGVASKRHTSAITRHTSAITSTTFETDSWPENIPDKSQSRPNPDLNMAKMADLWRSSATDEIQAEQVSQTKCGENGKNGGCGSDETVRLPCPEYPNWTEEDILDMAQYLPSIENAEDLKLARETWPPKIMQVASGKLPMLEKQGVIPGGTYKKLKMLVAECDRDVNGITVIPEKSEKLESQSEIDQDEETPSYQQLQQVDAWDRESNSLAAKAEEEVQGEAKRQKGKHFLQGKYFLFPNNLSGEVEYVGEEKGLLFAKFPGKSTRDNPTFATFSLKEIEDYYRRLPKYYGGGWALNINVDLH